MNYIPFSILLCLFAFISCGCGSKIDPNIPISLRDNYKLGVKQIKEKKFKSAIKTFDSVIEDYSYSSWAQNAEIMSSFAKFKARKIPDAIASLDIFIEMHPLYKHMDYVYYLRGRCYEASLRGIKKDVLLAEMAKDSYTLLKKSYPNSIYAKITKDRITELKNYVIAHNMHKAHLWWKQKDYISAIIILNNLSRETEEKNIFMPEIHYRLVECYLALNFRTCAKMHVDYLRNNFKKSKYVNISEKLYKSIVEKINKKSKNNK